MIERSKDELVEWLLHQIDFDENDPYGTGGEQSEYLWQILALILQ